MTISALGNARGPTLKNRILLSVKAAMVCGLMVLFFNSAVAEEAIGIVGQEGVLHVNAVDADRLIKKDPTLVILDVRTAREFKEGHIKGAINLDYYDSDFKKLVSMLDPQETYLLHCKSGRRSGRSLPILQSLGFKQIIHMDHGFDGWRRAGLEFTTQ